TGRQRACLRESWSWEASCGHRERSSRTYSKCGAVGAGDGRSLLNVESEILGCIAADSIAGSERNWVRAGSVCDPAECRGAVAIVYESYAGWQRASFRDGRRRIARRSHNKRYSGARCKRGVVDAGDGRGLVHRQREGLRGIRAYAVVRFDAKRVCPAHCCSRGTGDGRGAVLVVHESDASGERACLRQRRSWETCGCYGERSSRAHRKLCAIGTGDGSGLTDRQSEALRGIAAHAIARSERNWVGPGSTSGSAQCPRAILIVHEGDTSRQRARLRESCGWGGCRCHRERSCHARRKCGAGGAGEYGGLVDGDGKGLCIALRTDGTRVRNLNREGYGTIRPGGRASDRARTAQAQAGWQSAN